MREQSELKDVWTRFWTYFNDTWLKSYDVETWNIHHILETDNAHQVLINRTNNALENYNGKFKAAFHNSGHPTMHDFVMTLQEESHNCAQKYYDISKDKRKKKTRTAPDIPTIPTDYYTFKQGEQCF